MNRCMPTAHAFDTINKMVSARISLPNVSKLRLRTTTAAMIAQPQQLTGTAHRVVFVHALPIDLCQVSDIQHGIGDTLVGPVHN